MSEINDGGPAFPSEGEGHGNPLYHSPGMSLRDWFAGECKVPDDFSMAMAEAIAGREHPFPFGWSPSQELEVQRFWAEAEAAYRYMRADAMLAARAKAEGR